jgi:putative endonuclease
MAEWSIATVLKTVDCNRSGGSNPSLSAEYHFLLLLKAGFFMPFYTYIIKSLKDNGYYYGHTKDLSNRLQKHNAGKVRSTKSRIPFILLYHETFDTKSAAYLQELFFKSQEGKKYLHGKGII